MFFYKCTAHTCLLYMPTHLYIVCTYCAHFYLYIYINKYIKTHRKIAHPYTYVNPCMYICTYEKPYMHNHMYRYIHVYTQIRMYMYIYTDLRSRRFFPASPLASFAPPPRTPVDGGHEPEVPRRELRRLGATGPEPPGLEMSPGHRLI